ncbi:MAG: hypothetical protein GW788_04905 [Ignavibacteria bacterium]|nr:hypothetical protein [Ignavibacteria bacterium]
MYAERIIVLPQPSTINHNPSTIIHQTYSINHHRRNLPFKQNDITKDKLSASNVVRE